MYSQEMSYRVKDVLRIVFATMAVLSVFSLMSFDINDIRWLTTDLNQPLKNHIGFVGAYFSFYARFLFGNAVWVIPVLLTCWVFNSSKLTTYGELIKEFFGSFFVLVTLSALSSLDPNSLSDFLFKGGLVGPQVAGVCLSSLNYMGTICVLSLFLVLSLALATEFFLVSLVYTVARKLALWSWKFLGFMRLQVVTRLQNRRQRLEEDEEYEYEEEDTDDEYEYEYEEEEVVAAASQKSKPKPKKKPLLKINKPKALKKAASKVKKKSVDYSSSVLPSIDLLEYEEDTSSEKRTEDVENTSSILSECLKNFDIAAEVVAVSQGPVITVYEVQPAPGVKINRIVNLSNDIALALSAPSVRIVAPIPGKAVIGIEIPNKNPEKVFFKELIESAEFQDSESYLSMALGKDVSGEPLIAYLDKMPHLLIAGSTGSGKTVCINALIMSILYKSTPDEVRMIMVDPKMVEMAFYNGIPHLLTPVITNARKAADALIWAVSEMERRYEHFADVGVRNITGYHKRFENSKVKTFKSKSGEEKPLEKVPYIVVIIDELADLMMTVAQDVETSICRLAQLSRAVGIHLIIATQRPSVNVITGLIKSNLPCRISFRVASSIDSRTILDSKGGEALIGHGDMLFIPPGLSSLVRGQGCFLSDEEIRNVVSFLKSQQEPEYVNIFASAKVSAAKANEDDLYEDAVRMVIESDQASASFLQRRMRIGYNRASRLIDDMEDNGVISAARGSKPREILVGGIEGDLDYEEVEEYEDAELGEDEEYEDVEEYEDEEGEEEEDGEEGDEEDEEYEYEYQ